MSTLSLSKIKHDASPLDNVTLNSSGETIVQSLKGASGNKLQLRSGDSSYGVSLQNVSGIDLVSVDAVGRVTTPYQPTFYGWRNAGNVTGNATVVHNNVVTNVGSHYNSTTGIFTCPVAGMYEVFVAGHAENSQPTVLQIHKNGSLIAEEYANGAAYATTTLFAVVYCAANDQLSHVVNIGTFWSGNQSGLRMTIKLIS